MLCEEGAQAEEAVPTRVDEISRILDGWAGSAEEIEAVEVIHAVAQLRNRPIRQDWPSGPSSSPRRPG